MSTYFKYPVLFPINGKPTKKLLTQLKIELRANNSSVETYLGGSDHGYLGLILTDAEYGRINLTLDPFVAPNFPTALVISASLTAFESVNAKETHKEVTRVYREYKNVEKMLLRHIQTALEGKYINYLIDEDTGLIKLDIPTVLDNLFSNYGRIPSEEVRQKEAEVLITSLNSPTRWYSSTAISNSYKS